MMIGQRENQAVFSHFRSNAFWPIKMAHSDHSAVCLLSNALSRRTRRQRSASTNMARCIILHTREGNLAIPATSNLKRPRTLPNRSREDRIRDGHS
jgi:hypothetical protein